MRREKNILKRIFNQKTQSLCSKKNFSLLIALISLLGGLKPDSENLVTCDTMDSHMRLPKSLESGGIGLFRVLFMCGTSLLAMIYFVKRKKKGKEHCH